MPSKIPPALKRNRLEVPDIVAICALLVGILFLCIPSVFAWAQLDAEQGNVMRVSYEGHEVDVIEWKGEPSAPEGECAGLWAGRPSVSDGSFSYIVGHNPGAFHFVLGMHPGDVIYASDERGAVGRYEVSEVFDVPKGTAFEDVLPHFKDSGECIVLQACVFGNDIYRIVIATLAPSCVSLSVPLVVQ